jgi:ribosome-associated protein YbcJ (S4-like RNA binding protein)
MNKIIKMGAVILTTLTLTSSVLETATTFSGYNTVSAAKKHKKVKKLTNGKIVKLHDINIKITSWKVIPVGQKGNEYGEKPVIAFWYDTTNKTNKEIDPINAWLAVFSVYQDTSKSQVNELDVASLPDEKFLDTQTEAIKKNGTASNAIAYDLDSETVKVNLKAHKGDGGKLIAKQKIAIEQAMKDAKAQPTQSDSSDDTVQ